MSTYSESCNQTTTVKPANSWEEHLENLISSQHLYWKRNSFSFRNSKSDLEDTNTLFLSEKRNQNAVIFRTLFAYVLPESTGTHGCSQVNMLFSIILNSLLRMLPHVFWEPYSSHSACYVWLCSFLKMNASFLSHCCLIWKRKQHIFGTFVQIK